MKMGQIVKRNGEEYVVYKIKEFGIYAKNEIGNIILLERPSYLKIIK